MTKNILEIENLCVDINVPSGVLRAVQNIDVSVAKGETLCIVGESGCGKSITALSLMNLLPKSAKRTADKLTLDGQDLRNLSEREMSDLRGDRMAMIFQEPMTSLNPAYTIGNQLEEAMLRHRKVSDGGGARPGCLPAGKSRHHRRAQPARTISPSAFRRPAPARHDRHEPDVRAGAHPGRRTDHGARRDHPGANPASAGRVCAMSSIQA